MSEDPLTVKERHVLMELDAAVQLVWELPCISEADFQQVVIPALQDIQGLIMARATYRRTRAYRRTGAF